MTDKILISFCQGSAGHLIAALILAIRKQKIFHIAETGAIHSPLHTKFDTDVANINHYDRLINSEVEIATTHLNNYNLLKETKRTIITVLFNLENSLILGELFSKKYRPQSELQPFRISLYFDWYYSVVPSPHVLRFEWIFFDQERLLNKLSQIINIPVSNSARDLLKNYEIINLNKFKGLKNLYYNKETDRL